MNKRDFLKMLGLATVAGVAGMTGGLSVKQITAMPSPPEKGRTKETSFERVTRTKTIRVSWAPYAPSMIIDPNTGKKSGIFYDTVNMVGQYLGVKIDWVAEDGWGVIAQGLKANKYDMFSVVWPTGPRAMQGNFSSPAYFSVVYAYIRQNETRFNNYDDLNKPGVRIAVQDDDGITDIARAAFPRATLVSLPQSADTKLRLMDVMTGKADVTFDDAHFAKLFMDQNPKALKKLNTSHPLQAYANTMMFDNDDWRMKLLVDTAMSDIHNSGAIDRFVEKYTGDVKTFLRTARPYEALQ